MLNLPTTEIMEGELNFVVVADDAFKLHKNIPNLFSGNLTHDERIFNYRLSTAKPTVENSFGIVDNRF
jgi:diacylglycerol kinase family enzyme